MKLLIWCMKVCDSKFATTRLIKTHIEMKKIVSFILVIVMFALHAMAEEPKSSKSSKNIMLEIAQYNETSGRARAPMRIGVGAWYNAETNAIEISYYGKAEGEVFLYLDENIVEYDSTINTSLPLPSSHGLYAIEIISETWSAHGYIQL
jgi:hypothetical protein